MKGQPESAPSGADREAGGLRVLLRGEAGPLQSWIERAKARGLLLCVGIIVLGAGLYGAAMGWWRDPRQGLYTALKFPLIILLTTMGNGLLNAMLAPLLGLNLSWRQSFLSILVSFTIASAVLGSFSPLAAYVVWNTPPLSANAQVSVGAYSFIQVMHVGVIAFAGVVGNLRLAQLLRSLSGSGPLAGRVLAVWLAGNLFLGSQLSWMLRPFIGAPGMPVEFLRASAFKGNFYETVLSSMRHVFSFQ